MADAYVGVQQSPTPDRLVDNESLSVGGSTVYRQRTQVAGAAATEIAAVKNAEPAAAAYGMVVREAARGQGTMATSIPIVIASNQSAIPIDVDAPTSPQSSAATAAALAAGSSTNLDSDQVSVGMTGKLMYALVSSALPFRVELQTVSNGTGTTRITAFSWTGHWEYQANKSLISAAYDATAGLDGFRAVVTNMDTSKATDVYASFLYDEE